MAFITDKQTLEDLIIFGKGKGKSIYGIFNATHTRGGALILEDLFRYPLSDAEKINRRCSIIQSFQRQGIGFPFKNEWFDSIEHYLGNTDSRSRLAAEENTLQRKIRSCMGADTEYEQLHKGVLSGIRIINTALSFLKQMEAESGDTAFRENLDKIRELVEDPDLNWAVKEKEAKKLSYDKMVVYDKRLRYDGHDKLKKLLYQIYTVDVYVSVAEVAGKRGFVYGKALPQQGKTMLALEGIYHPLLDTPVANDLHVDGDSHVIFLTGANMAGKSTFMKTFGLVIFLAHLGFPLPAKRMEFTVQNGMYTTINLPDNLNMGYSHFYAEVLRVKKVAEQINRLGNLTVIFDELFRGTNVKDAYDATVAVTEAFATRRDCTFLISTHIIEAGETLKAHCDDVHFVYLPTLMQGNTPTYTYTLKQGITHDRHGMRIIHNERILDMLETQNNINAKI